MQIRTTIVIPCIRVEVLTKRCVSTCAHLYPGADIVVLADVGDGAELVRSMAQVVITGPVTIAAKRNRAAYDSKAEFLAFIDSDAYPVEGWLENAERLLDEQPELGAVGGPNLPPPNTRGGERYVGMALRSILVSGKWTYRKLVRPARMVDDLPSCNLVVRRQDFLALGGMNEVLFTGEDMDWCARLRSSGRAILYSPDVQVYHKNRNMLSFVLQRLTYGASVPGLLRQGLRLNFLLLAAPAIFLLFILTLPLALAWMPWMVLYISVLAAYALLVIVEACRHSDAVADVPGILVALLVGNLAPGIGTIAQTLRVMPNRRKIYRNDL